MLILPFSIQDCLKSRWIHACQPQYIKKNKNLNQIIPIEKSKLKIIKLDDSHLFKESCRKYGMSIQICDIKKIEDSKIELEVMYNKNYFMELIQKLTINMSKYDKQRLESETKSFENICLNPIFIYSSSKKYAEKIREKLVQKIDPINQI